MDYKKEIISVIEKMENEDFLCKVYSFIRGMLQVKKAGDRQ